MREDFSGPIQLMRLVQLILLLAFLRNVSAQGCPDRKYGKGCLQSCLCNWQGASSCDSTTGKCNCQDGYAGRLCDQDINECDLPVTPCKRTHTYCRNNYGSFDCLCPSGFLLSLVGYCIPCPTLQYAKDCLKTCPCEADNTLLCGGFGHCVCREGWTGDNCENSVDDCVSVTCPPGTKCVDGHRTSYCVCTKGQRVFQKGCEDYTVHAVTLQQKPGVGELLDVIFLYRVPDWYSAKFPNVPDFVYQLTIGGRRQDRICRHVFTEYAIRVVGHETFFNALKLNPRDYNYYSTIKLTFTQDEEIVVKMLPGTGEYDELVMVIDSRRKSEAETNCLQKLRIDGAPRSLQFPRNKRQSYNRFEAKWAPNRNCLIAPMFEWTFYSLTDKGFDQLKANKCLAGTEVHELNIVDLTLAAGEKAISDHRSREEIVPKGVLPLGPVMICVKAYVYKNKLNSAGSCGFIKVVASFVIQGGIIPRLASLMWPPLTSLDVKHNFNEPDMNSEIMVDWACSTLRINGTMRPSCPSDFVPGHVSSTLYHIPADTFSDDYTITLTATAWLVKFPNVKKTVTITFLRVTLQNVLPMLLRCRSMCGETIGTTGNLVLDLVFPTRRPISSAVFYNLTIKQDGVELTPKRVTTISKNQKFTSVNTFTFTTQSRTLKAGAKYSFMFTAEILNFFPTFDFPSTMYTGVAEYVFAVESAPQGNGCTFTPGHGEAVFTRFTLTCLNYQDVESKLPLTYRLYQQDIISGTGSNIYTLIAYSGSGLIENITMSNRNAIGTRPVLLKAEVVNVKGSAVEVPVFVMLKTLDQKTTLERVRTSNIVNSGGQEDIRTMKDIASMVNYAASATSKVKSDVRQIVLKNLIKLDVESAETIEHVSHVLGISVEKEDEIRMDGLDDGISVGSTLAKRLGKIGNDNFELTRKVAETQVNAMSKLLDVASTAGVGLSTVNETEIPGSTDMKNKNMNQSVTATDSFSSISNILLNLMTAANETVKMTTGFMELLLSLTNVSSNTSFKVESPKVKFELPTMDSGVLENEIVQTEFEIFKKNPYGWTAPKVHGDMAVVKVNFVRQSDQTIIKKIEDTKKTFRFSKPADIFFNYAVTSKERTIYSILLKTVTQKKNVKILRTSGCILLSIKVSTTSATAMKIVSDQNLQMVVKAEYTNVISHFESLPDAEMLDMPLYGVPNLQTTRGILNRKSNLLYLPQLTKQQMNRNKPYYRIKISLKLNQVVNTSSLVRFYPTNISVADKEETQEFYNVTIRATPHVMSCLHFDDGANQYLSDECSISMYSNTTLMYCRCVVAAAFTGSVLVLPRLINPLDIGLFLLIFKNPLVVSVVIGIWMLYFALVSWGHLRDKDDEKKREVTVLDDNRDDHTYVYLLCVYTDWSASAATTSNVFIYLKGSWSQSENHALQDPVRRLFESGAENWFMLATKEDVGELLSVVVWTDFSGASPSWFLNSIYVQNMQTNEAWICLYNSWISEHHGSGQLLAEIPSVKETDYVSTLKVQILNKGRNDIRNEHLWFGIIAKTSANTFTRVRRLTTCLTLLQALMILNLMFFGIRDKDDPGQYTEILDQRIHVTSVIIGVQTAVIVFVLGVFISMLFNRVAPYPKSKKAKVENVEDVNELIELRKVKKKNEDSDSDSDDSNDDDKGVDGTRAFRYREFSSGESSPDFNENYNTNANKETSESSESDDDKKSSKRSSKPTNTPFLVAPYTKSKEEKIENLKYLLELIEMRKVKKKKDTRDAYSDESKEDDKGVDVARQHSVFKYREFSSGDSVPDFNENYNTNANKETSESSESDEDEKKSSKVSSKPTNRPFLLPWWFIFFTWPLLIAFNIFLAYYIMLYGLNLGYEKSVEWVLTFLTGFTINVAIIQPLKVILLMFLLILFFKQRYSFKDQAPVDKLNEGIILVQRRKDYNRKYKSLYTSTGCKAPVYTSEAKGVLERHAVENSAKRMLRDLFLHTVYMVSVLVVAKEHMDIYNQFLHNQYVKTVFLGAPFYAVQGADVPTTVTDKIFNVEQMWDYITNVVAPTMITKGEFDASAHDSYLMGTARLRQIRAKFDNYSICEKLPCHLKKYYEAVSCSYTSFIFLEGTKSYKDTWASPIVNSSEEVDDSPYIYRTPKELNSGSFVGTHGYYSGGGYVLNLGRDDINLVNASLYRLLKSDWIDPSTRCLFVEFTLYNPGTNHFTSSIIAFEFTNFGALFPIAAIYSANFIKATDDKEWWLQLSEGIMIIFTLYYTFVEIQNLRLHGFHAYFGNLWNCLEVVTIFLAYTVGVLFFLRFAAFVDVMKDYQKYGHSNFLNFKRAFKYHSDLDDVMGLLSGLAIFKMLKVTSFNPFVVITFRSFGLCGQDFFGMSLLSVIIMFAFAMYGNLLFGRLLDVYMSVDRGLFTLMFFVLGETNYDALVSADLLLGRIYFLLVVGATQYIILNFFCSILREGYELTRYMAFKKEQETIKFMLNIIKFYAGFGPKNVKQAIAGAKKGII